MRSRRVRRLPVLDADGDVIIHPVSSSWRHVQFRLNDQVRVDGGVETTLHLVCRWSAARIDSCVMYALPLPGRHFPNTAFMMALALCTAVATSCDND